MKQFAWIELIWTKIGSHHVKILDNEKSIT